MIFPAYPKEYRHPDYWREYRKLEVRPGVFWIQWRNRNRFFKWEWWDSGDIWRTASHYAVPGVPEYSPILNTEFSAEIVDEHLDKMREAYRTQYWRDIPPPGYPRAV